MRNLCLLLSFLSIAACAQKIEDPEQQIAISSDLEKRHIIIEPSMGNGWETASLENVKVGDNSVSVAFSKEDGKTVISVRQTAENWTMFLRLPKSETSSARGKSGSMAIMDVKELNYYQISSADPSIEVYYNR